MISLFQKRRKTKRKNSSKSNKRKNRARVKKERNNKKNLIKKRKRKPNKSRRRRRSNKKRKKNRLKNQRSRNRKLWRSHILSKSYIVQVGSFGVLMIFLVSGLPPEYCEFAGKGNDLEKCKLWLKNSHPELYE